MLKKLSPPFLAFLQASGLVVYILILSTFFTFVLPNIPNKNEQFFAPIIMLLLFIVSAVISATLVLGRAGVLFWEKQYKESVILISWTVSWILLYFGLFVIYLYLN